MPYVVETHRRLAVHSPMRRGLRILLGLVALFPLLAPWQLIIEPRWESYFNPFFFFALAISIGATAVSAGFFWAAVAGVSSTMEFNKAQKSFVHTAQAPVMPLRRQAFPLREVRSVEVATQEWSDNGPSYALAVELAGGELFESASSWNRAEVEQLRERVVQFLAD